MRINKFLAHKGLATRRSADALIERGAVHVNGKPAVIGQQVAEDDIVTIADGAIPAYRYIAYYKARGVITHSPAPQEIEISAELQRVHGLTGLFPIGRLDKDSEGLIILTDDGRITGRLLNPDHGHERQYVVTLDKPVTGIFLKQMEQGVTIEKEMTKPARIEKLAKDEIAVTITEGKKHQIRRMCAALGYQVKRLVRTRIENIELGSMRPGNYRHFRSDELETFMSSIGLH